jgi:hypothetical protein
LKKYEWEREDYDEEADEFIKHFDEHGNFLEHRPPDQEENIVIKYHFKKDLGEGKEDN